MTRVTASGAALGATHRRDDAVMSDVPILTAAVAHALDGQR
jgi:hypothetical protein